MLSIGELDLIWLLKEKEEIGERIKEGERRKANILELQKSHKSGGNKKYNVYLVDNDYMVSSGPAVDNRYRCRKELWSLMD